MENVVGIGGLFFRANDPELLSQWYQQNLGITPTPSSYEQPPWQQDAGPTVFAPLPANTEYFGSKSQSWMINFRVLNLDALISQLRAAGIEVEMDPEEYPNGRFARLCDPEGNPIQLWQPT
jgi:predicted enzyme related to lactoylglutathione lyase